MQIEFEREAIVPALGMVVNVVERRQTLPILGNLLLQTQEDSVAITATDLELQIATRADAHVIEPGAITLPARKFVDICRTLPEQAKIKLQVDGDRVTVRSGRSRFVLSTLPAVEYPALESSFGEGTLKIEQGILKRLLEKTAFSMAQQDVRYYLNGLLLELSAGLIRVVATDGHRLAKAEMALDALNEWTETTQMIIPAKSVTEIKRLLSHSTETVEMEFGSRALAVRFIDTVLTTKLVDGRYPEYERVIPKNLEYKAIVERDPMRAALQRTSILSNEKYKGVRITFTPGLMALDSNNPEREEAEDEVAIDYDGDPITIGFNVSYLTDVLATIDGATFEVQFSDSNSSALWQDPETPQEVYVIMPMRL